MGRGSLVKVTFLCTNCHQNWRAYVKRGIYNIPGRQTCPRCAKEQGITSFDGPGRQKVPQPSPEEAELVQQVLKGFDRN